MAFVFSHDILKALISKTKEIFILVSRTKNLALMLTHTSPRGFPTARKRLRARLVISVLDIVVECSKKRKHVSLTIGTPDWLSLVSRFQNHIVHFR